MVCIGPKEADVKTGAPFPSECPKCGHDRVQTGYARDELEMLLQTGADIEAYCISCDQHWPISTEERADLARALARPA
jgi:hypothetical protein